MAKEIIMETILDDNQIIESNTEVSEETQGSNVENTEDFLEIKYNKESLRLDREKARELAQKGMNYEKAVERAKQEARDAYIAEQGYEWNGRAITTESEYREALREQELVQQYQNYDVPEEVIQELVENKKFREKYETEQQKVEREKAQERDFQVFLESYPDVKPEEIPVSVWQEVESGKSLIDAYMKHENKILKDKLGLTNKQESIQQRNQENASASIGAVKSNGESAPFFTKEQVTRMSTKEVNENWKAINDSMKKW
jgi:hypothetical protein